MRDKKGRFVKGHPGLPGKTNPNWKGADVGYTALHQWVYLHLGTPKLCAHCGSTTAKKYEWANISKKYRRSDGDWIRLCTSCHRRYDGHTYKRWATIRNQHA